MAKRKTRSPACSTFLPWAPGGVDPYVPLDSDNSVSLARSEYVSPDSDNSEQVWRARLRLIEAAKQVCPKFLETLLTEVFPLYSRLAEKGALAKEGYDFQKALWSDNPRVSPYEVLTEEGGLKAALSKWAAEFNVPPEANWLMVGALRTLQDWYVAPGLRKALTWDTLHGRSEKTAGTGEAFEFRYQGWDPRLLTWSAFSELLRRRFEEKVLEYEKKTRDFATSQGLVLAQRQYSPRNLEWFVLYQFAGKSREEIAQDYTTDDTTGGYTPDNSTVLKGIKAAAKLIGWDRLREPRHTRGQKTR
jgi:hypothetical protein